MTPASPLAAERFRAIVPPLLDDAYSLAKWLCRSADDAEDVVQDAAVRALKALETTSVDRPKPWFLAIVRNAAMTFVARNRRTELAFAGDLNDLDALASPEGDGALDPEASLIAREDVARLRKAMAALPAPLLEVLVMRDVNDLSYRDIALALGLPMGTVMSRLARARGALAKIVNESNERARN